uniref:Protein-l-isoaspartated-aspartate o-methyltransferase n=1 Tax=Xenopsylla cheopis TaxID=163159 RepID=A0A6M2DLC7_XENCH
MGTPLSTTRNNKELVDNLVASGYLRTREIIEGFKIVDRGDYVSPSRRNAAYADCAWKYKDLHLSAPSIYSFVLEHMQIQSGMSFLNVGSGTGYLSTIAGLLVGEYGVNHGIELNEDIIKHAEVCVESFLKNALPLVKNSSFCRPVFAHGNALAVLPNMLYDRIYIGAKCSEAMTNYFKQFLKIDGCLMIPISNNICLIQRLSSKLFHWSSVNGVAFASLASGKNNKESTDVKSIEAFGKPLSLKESCRRCIRDFIEREALKRIIETLEKDEELVKDRPNDCKVNFPTNKPSSNNFQSSNQSNFIQNKSETEIESIKREHMNNCTTCTSYAVQDNQAMNVDYDGEDHFETLEELEMNIARFENRYRWLLENGTIRPELVRIRQTPIHVCTISDDTSDDDEDNNDKTDDKSDVRTDLIEKDKVTFPKIDLQSRNENVTVSKTSERDGASCSHEEKAPKRPSEFDDESESKRSHGMCHCSSISSDEDNLVLSDFKSISSSSSSSSSSSMSSDDDTCSEDSLMSLPLPSFSYGRFTRNLQLDVDNDNDCANANKDVFCTYQDIKMQKPQCDKLSKSIADWNLYTQSLFISIFNRLVDELPLPEPVKNYIRIVNVNYLSERF